MTAVVPEQPAPAVEYRERLITGIVVVVPRVLAGADDGIVAVAFGSYCSPPEYHMRNSLVCSSQITCGQMTATFSHAVDAGFAFK